VQYEVNDGLQVVENWNATSDVICYGRRGELATNSREQQEITLLSLQLLQNCLMLVNTILSGLWRSTDCGSGLMRKTGAR
jgi:TnpA family transposase